MQFFANDAQAGVSDLLAQAAHRDEFEQIVVLPDAIACIADEGVFVRGFFQRPWRVARQKRALIILIPGL